MQFSLFDEPGEQRHLTVTDVVARSRPQDQRQASFQRLVRQIQAQRLRIEQWRDYQGRYDRRVTLEFMPVMAQMRKQRIAMAHLLDRQFQQRGAIRGKVVRQKLRSMILDLTRDLLAEHEDAAVIALYDKHSDLTYAEEAELTMALSQDLVEGLFGVDLDDVESSGSMDDMMARAAEKLRQAAEDEAARQPRQQSARATAADLKRAAAQKEASQSVRDVYRKLASVLHPDRASADLAPEKKTGMMQRVNQAYESGNLLELLNIQLEIEQIDAGHLANLSAERMGHYNRVLREQLAELKAELGALMAPYQALLPEVYALKPSDVDKAIDLDIRNLKRQLAALEADLSAFQDPRQLALAVRDYESVDDVNEFEALGALLDAFPMHEAPPPRQRPRKRKGKGSKRR